MTQAHDGAVGPRTVAAAPGHAGAVGRFWIRHWKSLLVWLVVLVGSAFTLGSLWTTLDNRVQDNDKRISKIERVVEALAPVVTRLEVLVDKLETKDPR